MTPKEYRELKSQKEAVAVEEIILPSGCKVIARRPPRAFWLGRKRLPQQMVARAMEAAKNGGKLDALTIMKALSPEEIQEGIQFQRDLICLVMVEPRVVVGDPQSDEELGLHELMDGDIDFLTQWAGQSAVTRIDGEAVSNDTLTDFPAD